MTPLGSALVLLVASPALMFAAHAIAYRALDKARARPTAHSSALVALVAAFLAVLGGAWRLDLFDQPTIGGDLCAFAYVTIVMGALGILYLDVVNIAETSLHMHLLLELVWGGGAPVSDLLERYSADRMIAARLERLVSIGQLRIVDGRCCVANRSTLRLSRLLDAWRVILGLRVSAFPEPMASAVLPGRMGR